MRIKYGFTLIELLVVMGIIAILAVMAAPSFLQMQNKIRFREDAQKFLDILGEARSNALSNKKCVDLSGNKHDSIKWSVYFGEGRGDFKLFCQWDDGTADYLAAEQVNEANFTLSSITRLYLVEDEIASSSSTYSFNNDGFVLVSYLSGTSQMKIESFGGTVNGSNNLVSGTLDVNNLNGKRQKDVRIILAWEKTEGNEVITICMNAIAGFPRISYGANDLNNDDTLTCPAE